MKIRFSIPVDAKREFCVVVPCERAEASTNSRSRVALSDSLHHTQSFALLIQSFGSVVCYACMDYGCTGRRASCAASIISNKTVCRSNPVFVLGATKDVVKHAPVGSHEAYTCEKDRVNTQRRIQQGRAKAIGGRALLDDHEAMTPSFKCI